MSCVALMSAQCTCLDSNKEIPAHLVDVLALELGDELLKAVAVSLNADGLEDRLDVGGRGGGVAAEGEEEVSRQVLHFDGLLHVLVSLGGLSSNRRRSDLSGKQRTCEGCGRTREVNQV